MTENISKQFLSLLDIPFLSRIRRNHGLEHATLNLLSRRYPGQSLAGHSDFNGFWILGNLSDEDVNACVDEALYRLRNGEHNLAVHPNCGTNFATAGVLAGSAAVLSMFGVGRRTRDKLERLPLAITLATLALIAAQPLGLLVQERVSTSGNPDGLEIVEITASQRGRIKAFRVLTRG